MAETLKYIRLLTGEDILAKVDDTPSDIVVLKKALRVMIVPSRDNPQQINVQFIPWPAFTEEKEVKVQRSHVVFMVKPEENFQNGYNQQPGYGSGLVLPQEPRVKLI